jgi:glycosyltransferase involved in cell wall biosynthesis
MIMMVKKINVLMLLDKLNIGGTETNVFASTKELLKKGVTVVIAGRPGPMMEQFKTLGCSVYTQFPYDRESVLKALLHIIKNHDINILHAHQLPSGRYARKISEKLGIPVIFTVHGTYYKKKKIRQLLLSKKSNTKVSAVSVSPPVQDWLQRQGIQNVLIPNGINMQDFCFNNFSTLRQEIGLTQQEPIALYASRLAWDKVKVCRQFIEAGVDVRKRYFPNLHLVIVGSGKYSWKIKSLVDSIHKQSGEKFIHLLGSRNDMPTIYSGSTCVVGTGRVALESMACERPVIAMGTRGLFGIVEPSNFTEAWEHYFCDHKVFQPYSKEVFTTCLANVLSAPSKHIFLGKQGRKYVTQHFQITHVVQQLIQLYESKLLQVTKV